LIVNGLNLIAKSEMWREPLCENEFR